MRGEDPGEGPVGDDQFDARPGQACEVRVLHGARGSPVLDDLGAHRPGHSRAEPVRADDVPGGKVDRRTAAVVSVHPDGATGIVEVHALDRDPEPHVRAGRGRGLRHERVENVATRRDEQIDPGAVSSPRG